MIELYHDDCLNRITQPDFPVVDCVIADLPYSEFPLINYIIRASRAKCKGVSLFFMYADDVFDLDAKPDQILHWVKPISTKNTSRRYSRFVEVICVYDLERGPFNQDMQWANRSGVFTDQLLTKPRHPHEKPPTLIQRLMMNHSNPGDLILDPCTGSGTTLEVARQNGRPAIGFEITEKYYELAQQRLGLEVFA